MKRLDRHFRRHLRRPKVSSRDETRVGSAAPSAAEPSLQRRKSGTFGGRTLPSAAESLLSSHNSTFGGKVRRPNHASTGTFGGRNHLRRPNLSSSELSLCTSASKTFQNTPNLTYSLPSMHTHSHKQRKQGN
ncbi:hypothetical protein MANES_14G157966v8 [Manihot esculenta]|uniref:Uncharacterized protein n=1 Tax=Manihot esculenta TaxID=3983 RepID=A0ACB7GH28_MANES|nr:hypothetical protein MANES_14G157966v8 [Manihot esculenta]